MNAREQKNPTPRREGRYRGRTLSALTLAMFVAGCTAGTSPRPAFRPATTRPPVEKAEVAPRNSRARLAATGTVSWYGPRFHGRKTSNGERFDQQHLTAAHRSLPFGALVEVTDLDTGRKVRVRINDRGPYVPDRILDLSHAAAVDLGIIKTGVANARIEVISPPLESWPPVVFSVQFGAYRFLNRAERRAAEIEATHGSLGDASATYYVVGPDRRSTYYRPRLGTFASKEAARAAARRLRAVGLDTLIVQEDREYTASLEDPEALALAAGSAFRLQEGSRSSSEHAAATQSR